MRQIFRSEKFQKEFTENGFFLIPFLEQSQVDHLLNHYNRLANQADDQGFQATMQISDEEYRRNVDKTIKAAVKHNIDNLLIDYKPLFANYITKKPGGREVGVHQDWSYLDENEFTTVNIWCPLVDVNEHNGALYVLKGSHKLTTPIRHTPYELPPWKDMFPLIKQYSELVNIRAGVGVIYNPRVIHYSNINHTQSPRIAIGLVNVPREAKSLHYFRNQSNGTDELLVFEADEDFFMRLDIGTCPRFAKPVGAIKYNDRSFTRKDLMELQTAELV